MKQSFPIALKTKKATCVILKDTDYDADITKSILATAPSFVVMNFGGAGGIKTLSDGTSCITFMIVILESKVSLQKIFDQIAAFVVRNKGVIVDGGTRSGVMVDFLIVFN